MHCCHLSAPVSVAQYSLRYRYKPYLRAACRQARAAACRPASSSSRRAWGRPFQSRGSSRTVPGRWATGPAGPPRGHSSAAFPCGSPHRGRQICWRKLGKRASKAATLWAATAQVLHGRSRGRNGLRRVSWPHAILCLYQLELRCGCGALIVPAGVTASVNLNTASARTRQTSGRRHIRVFCAPPPAERDGRGFFLFALQLHRHRFWTLVCSRWRILLDWRIYSGSPSSSSPSSPPVSGLAFTNHAASMTLKTRLHSNFLSPPSA